MNYILLLSISGIIHRSTSNKCNLVFPKTFKFGAATSAYQIEGAWNKDGKGESIWDRAVHAHPEFIVDGSNGDIACNSYEFYKQDVHLLKNLNADFYRFSIAWTRILPNGNIWSINRKGIDYYNKLINELLANDIEPYVTIFHWDLPQVLQDKGGWPNRLLANDFVFYANLLFLLYGDRVKFWITFNEFSQMCEQGYSDGTLAPFIVNPGVGGYECTHTALIAHGLTYRLYKTVYYPTQKGSVGVSIDGTWFEPNTNSVADREAAERAIQMNYGWHVHPIILGNYPPIMIQRVKEMSLKEGYKKSRLPEFTKEEVKLINGSSDFLGLNFYVTLLATPGKYADFPHPSHAGDVGVKGFNDPKWETGAQPLFPVVPWALRKLLVWIKKHYHNPPVIVTENGFSDSTGELNDVRRVDYYRQYLTEVHRAIYEENCNVIGYTAWSLMDNFEWIWGFNYHFGLVHVDFNNTSRTRTPKRSYTWFQRLMKTKILNSCSN